MTTSEKFEIAQIPLGGLIDVSLHPNGRCRCADTGQCDWCVRLERLEAEDINGTASRLCDECDGEGVIVLGRAGPGEPRPPAEDAIWVRDRDDGHRLERLCGGCDGTGWRACDV